MINITEKSRIFTCGDTHGTIENLEVVIKINQEIPMAWFRLGNAYFKQNEYNKAAHAFETILKLKPYTVSENLQNTLTNEGAFPLKTYAQYNLARIALQQEDYEKQRFGTYKRN